MALGVHSEVGKLRRVMVHLQALAKPEAKDWVSDHILSEREVGITAAQRGSSSAKAAAAATA